MLKSGESEVRSPLLNPEALNKSPEELVDILADEIKDINDEDFETKFIDERLTDYNFSNSIQEGNPEWWTPITALVYSSYDNELVEGSKIKDWAKEVTQRLNDEEDYNVVYTEEFNVIDNITGKEPPIVIPIGTAELDNKLIQVNSNNSNEINRITGDFSEVKAILNERTPSRNYDQNEVAEYSTELNGANVNVIPDLSSGIFKAEVEFGGGKQDAKIWMPYANQDEAVLISPPSDFDNDIGSYLVSTSGETFTDDPLTNSVIESLSYYLPFEGVAQTEISSDAVRYRNDNPLDKDPYDIRFLQEAWEDFNNYDEFKGRIIKNTEKIALNPDSSPLTERNDGKIEQICGKKDLYLLYETLDNQDYLNIKRVFEREEAFPERGKESTRT